MSEIIDGKIIYKDHLQVYVSSDNTICEIMGFAPGYENTEILNIPNYEIPDIKYIRENAFRNKQSLKKVIIESGVNAIIEDYAFAENPTLTEVYIPQTIKNILCTAFLDCPNATIYYEGSEYQWRFIIRNLDKVPTAQNLGVKKIVFGYNNSLTKIDDYLYRIEEEGIGKKIAIAVQYIGSGEKVELPSNIKIDDEEIEVVRVESSVFSNGHISTLDIFESDLESIWAYTPVEWMVNCTIDTIRVSSSWFEESNLSNLPAKHFSFFNTASIELNFNDYVKKITVYGINSTEDTDPYKQICSLNFADCANLYKVDLMKNDGIMPDYRFNQGCFKNCKSLTSITLPNNYKYDTIEANTFENSGIENITIPDNIKIIKKEAFKNCFNLKQFSIGNVILDGNVFEGCENLKKVEFINLDQLDLLITTPSNLFKNCKKVVVYVHLAKRFCDNDMKADDKYLEKKEHYVETWYFLEALERLNVNVVFVKFYEAKIKVNNKIQNCRLDRIYLKKHNKIYHIALCTDEFILKNNILEEETE